MNTRLDQILKAMPQKQVEEQLQKGMAGLPIEKRWAVEDLTLGYCYDRIVCNSLGVNYANIKREDINKLLLYSFLVLEAYHARG